MNRPTNQRHVLPAAMENKLATGRAARSAARAAVDAPAKSVVTHGAGEIRIIGGQWKRTRLKVAPRPGLRPTPDRVRETLFNWLGQDLTGWHCLDAFAGTGALGLEAASRGAVAVQLVEQDPAVVAHLHAAQQQLKAVHVRVQRGDGLAALRHAAPGSLHLVLLDPPFDDQDLCQPALQAAVRALAPQGFVYLEASVAWTAEALEACGLQAYRYMKAGAVHAHLLRLLGAA